jgi:hypothetical protein
LSYTAPEKKGDSANPKNIRTVIIPAKFLVAAAHIEMEPQTKMASGR